ncbi:hypothetical protein [Streptomyces poriticola]|uniref:hypothetical protein n=1 Tax=Streptomyces poriticola TaxID=3120506 RepID=UPI002FCDFD93
MSSQLSWLRRRAAKKAEVGPWELREGLRSRAAELQAVLRDRKLAHPDDTPEGRRVHRLADDALNELDQAVESLDHDHHRHKTGAHIAVGQIHVDTAQNLLLRLSRPDEIVPMMPGILAIVQAHLSPSDPRRVQVEIIAQSPGDIGDPEREMILDAVGVARQTSIRETLRVRSFVNIVGWVAGCLAAGAVLVALLGAFFEDTVPLCFAPQNPDSAGYMVVCPVKMDPEPRADRSVHQNEMATTTAADYLVIEIVGLVAAGIAAATTLRRIKGTATPYNVPVALALLKLPTGALTAVFGLLLMRGHFIPGLSALDSSAQIIAWAIILGYSQQLFTRLVDSQAQTVLNAVAGPNSAPPQPPPSVTATPARPS